MLCMNASNRHVFFLNTIRAVCYTTIDWKNGLEFSLSLSLSFSLSLSLSLTVLMAIFHVNLG